MPVAVVTSPAPTPPAPGVARPDSTPGETRYYLCALVARGHASVEADVAGEHGMRERLLVDCQSIVERVELARIDAWQGALLDLGSCATDEARLVCVDLLARLRRHGLRAWASAGPTLALAELLALATMTGAGDTGAAPRFVTLEEAPAWLSALPLRLLTRLDPARALPLAVIEQLERYGLRTLGHVARLDQRDPQALRRQIGMAHGARLVAHCHGMEPLPLRPEPLPMRIAARRIFFQPASPDQALAALDRLAARLAGRLAARGKQGREIRLRVVWESGATMRARRRLARPLAQPGELAQAARGLFATLAGHAPSLGREATEPPQVALTSLTLACGDLSVRYPAQPALLFASARKQQDPRHERAARLARIAAEVGAPLTLRYGAPALYHLETAQPDAILAEERVRLIHFGQATPPSGKQAQPARAAAHEPGRGDAVTRVTPPQPHLW